MNQEKADEIFDTPIGGQLLSFYYTYDGLSFLRHKEAFDHVRSMGHSEDKAEELVTEWLPSKRTK